MTSSADEQAGGPRVGGAASCAACGAKARRPSARFCSACGRGLDEEYVPGRALRASYGFRMRPSSARAARRARRASKDRPAVVVVRPRGDVLLMPSRNNNGASTTALAFATYALVPYLGILFCPGALLMGGVGLLRARRDPDLGGLRASAAGLVLGLVIFCAQLLLWWILYKVPEWSRSAPF
ncbi:MAG TPA: hypothetical protein VGX48_05330 [Pyrinomonadaceae bacterium]|jgi:hypothetical protein|nr:hypothetical protein [Pyrinomonadaceae bacterium]